MGGGVDERGSGGGDLMGELFEEGFRTLCFEVDRAVGFVADETDEVEIAGEVADGGAEAHALDSTGESDGDAHGW